MNQEHHFTNRGNWIRAAVLGANDGIISTTSLVIGIAAAQTNRQTILLTALAGLVAGACSMAAGEFVSVSSQSDIESADIAREKKELETMPDAELNELATIYQKRGLDKDLSLKVAQQLMNQNALEAHARDELGINDMTKPHPIQAAMASAASFIIGASLPLIVTLLAPLNWMVVYQYSFAIIFLAIYAAIAAKIGGTRLLPSIFRICFWGTIAMIVTAIVGFIFGTHPF